MRVHRLLAAVIGLTALAAVPWAAPAAAAGPVTAAAAHAAPPPSLPPGWRRCANPDQNFSVGYPGTWYTTQIRPEEVCAQFHPAPFTIPPESEYPLTALNVRRVPAPPDRTDTEFERVLRWERVTVAGRTAVRFETSATGAGLYQEGTRQYGYVLRLGHGLISVHATAEPGESGYPAWRRVVDKAVRTLAPAPGCVGFRPAAGFYEAGRVATEELTTPASRCTTISVSGVVDVANPADRCQTFRVAFWPLVDGSLTYTEPVTACGDQRTILAGGVPDGARYMVLYDIDHLGQEVGFRVWH